MLGTNADARYAGGAPTVDELNRHGIGIVRLLSLPANEAYAEQCLANGTRVIAVYTGESELAGKYVLDAASAVQIGNEPMMGLAASWPAGNAAGVVSTWMRVRDYVWDKHGVWFPLVGPGIWSQRADLWKRVADRLEGVVAAAVHVYPDASGHTQAEVVKYLLAYREVRADLPLLCSEWTARWPRTLEVVRALDEYCDDRAWYTWADPGQPHHTLVGTPELGILAMAK